jgi:hypothetical protein
MDSKRRSFVISTVAAGAALAVGTSVQAQKPAPMVDENDAQAKALGYAADGGKVDTKKFPKYATGQACSNCQLYQGKPKEASGPCPLYPGKQVSAKAWCSAYVKKAA